MPTTIATHNGTPTVKIRLVAMPRDQQPEPNFRHLVTGQDLHTLVISAHALRRFVERLQPTIPGADQVADAMPRLEDLGSGNRSGPEQGQLNRYRDWMAKHVEPHVLELIRCEGFWTTERPRWSRSETPSHGYLQLGGMCGFPTSPSRPAQGEDRQDGTEVNRHSAADPNHLTELATRPNDLKFFQIAGSLPIAATNYLAGLTNEL
jgi:hypothetical protein